MSFDVTQAFSMMKKLAAKVHGSDSITRAQAEEMLKNADTDGDSIISLSEFKDFYMSTEDYQSLEDDYLEAFEFLSGLDGEDGFSIGDLDSAIEQTAEAEETEEVKDSDSVGGSSGGSYTPKPTTTDNTGDDKDSVESTVKSVSLTGDETTTELRTGRSDVLDDLSELRNKKADVKSEQAYEDAENAYNTASMNYDKSLDDLAQIYIDRQNANDDLTKEQENFLELKKGRDEINGNINTKNSDIDNLNTNISNAESAKADLEATLNGLEPPSEDLIKSIYDEETGEVIGQDTSAYDAAMAEYEAQKAELESQIAEKESEITDLEASLAEAEEELTNLQENLLEQEKLIKFSLEALDKSEEKVDNLDEAEQAQIQATKESQNQFINDWENLVAVETELTAQIDADIAQCRENLKTYDDALDKKDEEAQAGLPDGMYSKNGYIYEGEGENARLMLPVEQTEEGANLPENYQINDDGTITDETGKTVGKVVEIEKDVKNDDGVPETVESLYLYSDNYPKPEIIKSSDESETAGTGDESVAGSDTTTEKTETTEQSEKSDDDTDDKKKEEEKK